MKASLKYLHQDSPTLELSDESRKATPGRSFEPDMAILANLACREFRDLHFRLCFLLCIVVTEDRKRLITPFQKLS